MQKSVFFIEEKIIDKFRLADFAISNSNECYNWAFVLEYIDSFVKNSILRLIKRVPG